MSNAYKRKTQWKGYDRFEARSRRGGIYRFVARKMLEKSPISAGAMSNLAVDIGCGTGNSTLVLAEDLRVSRVIGVDSSPQMLAFARKKLALVRGHIEPVEVDEDSREIVSSFDAGNLAEMELRLGDVRKLGEVVPEKAQLVFGNHVWHWVRQGSRDEGIAGIRSVCREGTIVALSSSFNFYGLRDNDPRAAILYQPFSRAYFEELRKIVKRDFGYESTPKEHQPRWEADEEIAFFEGHDFELIEFFELPLPPISRDAILDFVLRVNPEHLGYFGRQEDGEYAIEIPEDAKERMMDEALGKVLADGKYEVPIGSPVDINPVFIFRAR